jgi:myo-inositol-1(or 4)-monophosphatase
VNARDLLTEVDGEVQRIIETRVAEAFPEHGFLVSTARAKATV